MSNLFESLEPRRLLATFPVTTLDDSGAGSLREAIALANAAPGADIIEFAEGLTGTITLGGTALSITDDLTIQGPGADSLTISGDNASRVISVFDGITVSISGLTLTDGAASDGGGLYNSGNLTLTNIIVSGNIASFSGGGIFNDGSLTISHSTIAGNSATIAGGGIGNSGSLIIASSTISGNSVQSSGGGIETSGAFSLVNSTVSGNTAAVSGGGILINADTHTIANSTIADNTAVSGAGIFIGTGTLTMRSTIVAGNPGGDIVGTLEGNSTHNLIQDALSAGGLADGVDNNILGVDPLLSPLANYGGRTQTHALGAGSPAIGGGINSLALSTDQRGTRFTRGNTLDIGSYQRQVLRLTVDILGDEDDGNYTVGNLSLREAIALTNANPLADEISFALSLREETITLGGTELAVIGDLTLAGLGASVLTIDADGASRVFSFATGVSVTLTGMTITGGVAAPNSSGGGIINRGTLNLSDMIISGNAANSGGGIFNEGTLAITNTSLTGNNASAGSGGGVHSIGALTVAGSTLSSNTATSTGGGIASSGGSLTITGSTLSANTATDGAGIFSAIELTMADTTFSANIATNNGGGLTLTGTGSITGSVFIENAAEFGGGIFNGGTLTATASVISANQASFGGGIVNSTTMTLAGSTLTGNTASNSGGGLHNLGTMTLFNSTIAINVSDEGGGGIFNVGTLDLANSTITQNTSGATGGGIRDEQGILTMRSTIVAGNTGGDIDGTLASGSTNNLVQDASFAGGLVNEVDGNLIGVDPRLGQINDTSGVPQFFPLLAGSPAIGMGINPLDLTTDQRGEARVQGSRIDIGSFEASVPPTPAGTSDASNAHSVVSVDDDGNVLVFRQGWTFENLQSKTSAPVAIGAAIIWVDPKDGLTYVAAPSEDGLLLFSRATTGEWSFRNLTEETSATNTPTRDLTHFISVRENIVVIAGITADDRVVAFRQTLGVATGGGPEFVFVDISADLESQGQQTPNLTGLTSYVPRWDTWHLAGVDDQGRIQSIWINTNNPNFTKWRTDNLSAITGAPAIAGQLSVSLTSWGGINLTGLDTNGNLLTTWWVPRFAGLWAITNLTERFDGPKMVGGNVAAYTTPWGGINYVGLDTDGTVRVYWWVPSFGGTWAVSPLLPAGTPSTDIPTGALTSSSSSTGTLNVYGLSTEGNVLRMSWQPGGANIWNIEDLTEIAEEV